MRSMRFGSNGEPASQRSRRSSGAVGTNDMRDAPLRRHGKDDRDAGRASRAHRRAHRRARRTPTAAADLRAAARPRQSGPVWVSTTPPQERRELRRAFDRDRGDSSERPAAALLERSTSPPRASDTVHAGGARRAGACAQAAIPSTSKPRPHARAMRAPHVPAQVPRRARRRSVAAAAHRGDNSQVRSVVELAASSERATRRIRRPARLPRQRVPDRPASARPRPRRARYRATADAGILDAPPDAAEDANVDANTSTFMHRRRHHDQEPSRARRCRPA